MGFFGLFKKQPKKEIEQDHVVTVETESAVESGIPEEELVAIFTAAIQGYFAPTSKLVIRTYKRVENNIPIWNRVARENLVNG